MDNYKDKGGTAIAQEVSQSTPSYICPPQPGVELAVVEAVLAHPNAHSDLHRRASVVPPPPNHRPPPSTSAMTSSLPLDRSVRESTQESLVQSSSLADRGGQGEEVGDLELDRLLEQLAWKRDILPFPEWAAPEALEGDRMNLSSSAGDPLIAYALNIVKKRLWTRAEQGLVADGRKRGITKGNPTRSSKPSQSRVLQMDDVEMRAVLMELYGRLSTLAASSPDHQPADALDQTLELLMRQALELLEEKRKVKSSKAKSSSSLATKRWFFSAKL